MNFSERILKAATQAEHLKNPLQDFKFIDSLDSFAVFFVKDELAKAWGSSFFNLFESNGTLNFNCDEGPLVGVLELLCELQERRKLLSVPTFREFQDYCKDLGGNGIQLTGDFKFVLEALEQIYKGKHRVTNCAFEDFHSVEIAFKENYFYRLFSVLLNSYMIEQKEQIKDCCEITSISPLKVKISFKVDISEQFTKNIEEYIREWSQGRYSLEFCYA